MEVIFRVDGGYKIGMGHIARCVNLAKYIRSAAYAKIAFITKNFNPGIKYIKREGFPVHCLPQEISLREDGRIALEHIKEEENAVLVIDIPQIKEGYLEYIGRNKNSTRLVYLDSFGIKNNMPEVVINPSIVREWYPPKKNKCGTSYFLGPSYWILDGSYLYYHNKEKKIKKNAKKILISVGGADKDGLTARILGAVLALEENLTITVVIGPAFDSKIKKSVNVSNKTIIVKRNMSSLAGLMFEADIGIITGGFTLYEVACVGLPSLAVCKVPHQLKTVRKFEELGITKRIGSVNRFNPELLKENLRDLIYLPSLRKNASIKGKALIDAKGSQRVWQAIKDAL